MEKMFEDSKYFIAPEAIKFSLLPITFFQKAISFWMGCHVKRRHLSFLVVKTKQ